MSDPDNVLAKVIKGQHAVNESLARSLDHTASVLENLNERIIALESAVDGILRVLSGEKAE